MTIPISSIIQLGSAAGASGGAAGGAGGLLGGFGEIFSPITDKLTGENFKKTQARLAGNLNTAKNIGLSIPTNLPNPEIDPGLGSKVDTSVFAQLADSIIEQSGLGDLMKQLKPAETADVKKTTGTKKTDTASDASATQATAKPVGKAKQSREEGRSNVEQLFLDLINGNIDITF